MNSPALPEAVTFCGRTFSRSELELMRQIAAEFVGLGRTEIAHTICELVEWKRPSGGLKNHECRHLLERLEQQRWQRLPTVRRVGPRGPRRVRSATRSEPQAPVEGATGQYAPLRLTVVAADPRGQRLLAGTGRALSLPGLSSAGGCPIALPGALGAHRPGRVGLPPVDQRGLEDGGARPLDRLE